MSLYQRSPLENIMGGMHSPQVPPPWFGAGEVRGRYDPPPPLPWYLRDQTRVTLWVAWIVAGWVALWGILSTLGG
jgi:hypothetical protein